MRTLIGILISFIFLNISAAANHIYAANVSEAEYRSKWFKVEQGYLKEHRQRVKEEQIKKDVELYLEMGRDYMEHPDFPAALICFRDIIALEADLPVKEHTSEAKELITQIESKLQEDIRQELGVVLKQDFERRREGSKRILESVASRHAVEMPPEAEAPVPAEPKKKEEVAKVEKPVVHVDEELLNRKKALEYEIASKRAAVDAELEVKRLEFAKKQMETDSLIYLAREMLKNGNYTDAIAQANKVLTLDKNNLKAREIVETANKRIEKEKYLAKKKEEDEKLAIERDKKRQQEAIKAQEEKKKKEIQAHLDKGVGFLRNNQFLEATGEFKYTLELDPFNSQAKFYLLEIKSRLEKAIGEIKKPAIASELSLKSKLKSDGKSAPESEPAVASEPVASSVKSKLR